MRRPSKAAFEAAALRNDIPTVNPFMAEADGLRDRRRAIVPCRGEVSEQMSHEILAYNAALLDLFARSNASGYNSNYYLIAVDDHGFDMDYHKLQRGAWADTVLVLDVSYEDKDAAKAKGAKWNADHKTWYAPLGSSRENFAQWLDTDEDA